MSRDEIIKMAREAGFTEYEIDDGTPPAFDVRYERFFKLAFEAGRKAEQERCAQIADAHASIEGIAQTIAAEIRSDK